MKRCALVLAMALPLAALAETSTWTFDSSHTSTTFSVKHLVVSTVRGQFGKTTGTIRLDEDDVTRSSVQAAIDATTVDTRHEKRDQDLRSPRFFDVASHPQLTFRSTKVEKVADGKLRLTGDLTIKGTAKPVTFDATLSPPAKGYKQEVRRAFTATTQVNRKDFGLNYNDVVEAGPVVGDEVTILIEGEAVRDGSPRQTSGLDAAPPRRG